jgi:hypothetical protein
MESKRKTTTFFMDKGLWIKFKLWCVYNNASMSKIITKLVTEFLADKKVKFE